MLNVFVYGTLKPGEINDWVWAKETVTVCPAIAPGQLYALPFGYPAMVAGCAGSEWVHGFLLSLTNPESLTRLDEFEQHDPDEFRHYAPGLLLHQHQYQRQPIETFEPNRNRLMTAWAYLMTAEQVRRLGGILLPDGLWCTEK
jgi:gamma-glutamylcyclotransferase (GGCT)/AIG2-like uncharacterized protein YtfP